MFGRHALGEDFKAIGRGKVESELMALIVQKYGGTSVGDLERIENVARRVVETKAAGHQVVVNVSAMAGETNRLVDLAEQAFGSIK